MTLETNSSFSLILNKSKTIFGYYFRGVFGFLFFQCPLVIDPDRVSFFVTGAVFKRVTAHFTL